MGGGLYLPAEFNPGRPALAPPLPVVMRCLLSLLLVRLRVVSLVSSSKHYPSK
jgi:hypothetical protein